MTYQIVSAPDEVQTDYTPRGGCADFIYAHEPEVIAVGPADTGKTLAGCWKLHLLLMKYAGAQWGMVRKTRKSMDGSVLQTWEKVIEGAPVKPFGGERPEHYIYPNGSKLWIGGMDNPDKVLSSERDGIYVNQAEELSLDDWEKLSTRTTGRGAVMPYTQLIGDCNPAGQKHWIRQRSADGKLKLILTTHRDNPTIYNPDGTLTPNGQRRLAALDALTGVRRKRLYEGIWATAEGAVFDMFDASVHVKVRPESEMKAWYLAEDEGYTNPAVILLIGADSDDRWHVFQEFYERGKLQSEVVAQSVKWSTDKGVELAAVDAAAAGLIADLTNNGVPARAAKGRVLDGIQVIQDRLRVAKDGRPRLTFDPSCINTINDFESYSWKPEKDEPKKENDHAPDAIRYLADALGTVGVFEALPDPFDG